MTANVPHPYVRFSRHKYKPFPQNDKNHEKRLFINGSGTEYFFELAKKKMREVWRLFENVCAACRSRQALDWQRCVGGYGQ